MSMNQLHQLAQRSCFNLPAYTFIRKGPDHSPRFKASVNFNGEVFDSPRFYRTLQHAKHAAAKVALQFLCSHGPLKSLIAKILDETGVYKNLLQEISQRVGAPLPLYTTIRSGLGHLPVFTCTVELAGIEFTGEPAKNKKQAEKNAAMAAWFSLKQLAKKAGNTSSEPDNNDEQEQITIARALLNYRLKEKVAMAKNPLAIPFPKKFPVQPEKKPSVTHQAPSTRSKLLPLIQPNSVTKMRPSSPLANDRGSLLPDFLQPENHGSRPHKFPAAGAAPYVPVRNFSMPYRGMAPPVTIRTAVPCFSSLSRPNQPGHQLPPVMNLPVRMASPVRIRPAVPVFAAPTPEPAMLPIIPGQPKEQPQFAVKYMLPDAVLPDIKSVTPTVAVASSDPPVTPAHLKIEPAHIAVASLGPLLMPGQGKEQPPVAVELPPDVVLPDSPFKPVLLRGSATVVPSAEAMQRVLTEDADGAENDLLEIGALECFKRLEI